MTMRALLSREAAGLAEPDDEPKPEFSRVRHITSARKSHPCGYCDGGRIQPGQAYVEYVEIDAGQFRRMTYCASNQHCPALAKEMSR